MKRFIPVIFSATFAAAPLPLHATGFPASLSLSSLTGPTGTRADWLNPGDNLGFAVTAAGDI